jgi:hypothetical protein
MSHFRNLITGKITLYHFEHTRTSWDKFVICVLEEHPVLEFFSGSFNASGKDNFNNIGKQNVTQCC